MLQQSAGYRTYSVLVRLTLNATLLTHEHIAHVEVRLAFNYSQTTTCTALVTHVESALYIHVKTPLCKLA